MSGGPITTQARTPTREVSRHMSTTTNEAGLWPLIRTWWWALLLGAVVAAVAAYGLSSKLPKSYSSQATLLVGPVNTDVALDASGTLTTTYAQLATTDTVLRAAINSTGAGLTPLQLKNNVSTNSNTVTRIVTISVSNSDPKMAASLANAIAARLGALASSVPPAATAIVSTLDSQPEVQALSSQARAAVDTAAKRAVGVDSTAGQIQVVDPALPPSSPSSPNKSLLTLLAGLIGIVIVGVIVMARELRGGEELDEDTIRDIASDAYIGSLAVAPTRNLERALPMESHPSSNAAKQYRALAARLHLFHADENVRSLLVLDATDGATAGVVALNLAVALRESNRRVLVVDANTQGGGATWLLGLQGNRGYSDAIADPGTLLNGHLQDLCVERGDDLVVLPRGTGDTTDVSNHLVQQALLRFGREADVVIVSGPPISGSPAALAWAQCVDGTLLVVDPAGVSRGQVLSAVADLDLVKARTLGLVLGRVNRRPVRG
jgi:tyrosine-protein kinase